MLRYILIPLLAIGANAFLLDGKFCDKVGLFAHKDNSSMFYSCNKNEAGGFVLTPFICPNGQVFNNAVGRCVLKVNSKSFVAAEDEETTTTEVVIAPITTPPPETSGETSTEHMADTTTTTDTPPPETTEPPTESTEPTTETTNHPTESTDNPTGNTEPTTETTEHPTESTDNPTGTTEPTTETTNDHPTGTTEPGTGTTDTSNETTDGTTETGGTETTDSTQTPKPFVCPSKGFFPANGACDRYIYCYPEADQTLPIELECPEGQYFNPCILICDENYDCGDCTEENTEPTTVATTETTAEITTETSSEGSTDTTTEAGTDTTIEAGTDTTTEAGTETTTDITTETSLENNVKVFKEFDCTMEGIFADLSDHSRYFECKWNQEANKFQYQHHSCAENQVFHKLTGRCGSNYKLSLKLQSF